MTSCYDKFTLLGTFAHSRVTGSLSEGFHRGVYLILVTFSINLSAAKAVHNSQKVTESSISMDSAGNHVLFQGVWRDMASDIAAALREIYWTASKT